MKSTTQTSLLFAALLLLAPIAPGQITLNLETTSYTSGYGTHATDTVTNLAANSATVSTTDGSGSATASLGSMQLSSSSSATHVVGEGFGDTYATTGFSQAKWSDNILVTAAAPELNGTNGWLHAQFIVSGSLNVPFPLASDFTGAQPASAGWQVSVNRAYQFGGENSVGGTQNIYIDYTPGPPTNIFSVLNGSPDFDVYDIIIPFTFGEVFDFQLTGQTTTFAQPRGMEVGDSLSSSANITVTWLGVSNVTDTEDNLLSGITISSTGDWITASAIPEPSTYAALAGLAALGLAAWRRRGAFRL